MTPFFLSVNSFFTLNEVLLKVLKRHYFTIKKEKAAAANCKACDGNTFSKACDGNTFSKACDGNTFSKACDGNTGFANKQSLAPHIECHEGCQLWRKGENEAAGGTLSCSNTSDGGMGVMVKWWW